MDMIFQYLKKEPMFFDNGLIMAIIAINMTVIGLTSLADKKTVIGIDYGNFLIKKFKISGIRMYYWLIIFASTNLISLFIIFMNEPAIRIINFFFLLFSLVFAILYFFGFILIENKWVVRQIYITELLGLYCNSEDTKHLYIDNIVHMNPGTRTNYKLATNVIDYFNTFNSDTQKVFFDVFGPNSLIYDDSKKINKIRKKLFNVERYRYRSSELNNIKEISFEFFQMFRYSEYQDKWAIDIIVGMNGEPPYNDYDIYRLYNLARLIVQIDIFGFSENLCKYKFIFYLKKFLLATVDTTNNMNNKQKEHIIEVEHHMMKALFHYIVRTIKYYNDVQYIKFVEEFLDEIVNQDSYKGYLNKEEILFIAIDHSLELDCGPFKRVIELIIQKNLQSKVDKNNRLNKEKIQKHIDIKKKEYEADMSGILPITL